MSSIVRETQNKYSKIRKRNWLNSTDNKLKNLKLIFKAFITKEGMKNS